MAGVPGANEEIVLGFIGMGLRGSQLVKNIPATGRIAAVCDADARKSAEVMAANQADWAMYVDYRRLLERQDLDAVLICTPHHQHGLPGILACQAGLDVYLEKPLSLYVVEGRALVRAARKYGRVMQTGSQQRTMELNRFACEFVRDGGIGQVRVVEAVNYAGPHPYPAEGLPEEPIPNGLDWDQWQGLAPTRPFNRQLAAHWSDGLPRSWIHWRDYSGASMADMGAHAYDMVQYALGADDSGPVEFWPVEGEGPRARIDFRYANGVEVRLRFANERPYIGPRAGAVFSGEHCKIEINRNKYTTNPPDFIADPPDPRLADKWEGEGWLAHGHVQNWFDCIKTREKPNADVEIGHRTVTIAHLCNIARELGRRLRWDPEREQVVDDPEANALLARPRRTGWDLPDV